MDILDFEVKAVSCSLICVNSPAAHKGPLTNHKRFWRLPCAQYINHVDVYTLTYPRPQHSVRSPLGKHTCLATNSLRICCGKRLAASLSGRFSQRPVCKWYAVYVYQDVFLPTQYDSRGGIYYFSLSLEQFVFIDWALNLWSRLSWLFYVLLRCDSWVKSVWSLICRLVTLFRATMTQL